MSMTELKMEKIAIEAASLSPCAKRKVGAAIAKINRCGKVHIETGLYDTYETYDSLVVGYNNNGKDVCEDINGETVSTVIHAEIDALNKLDIFLKEAAARNKLLTHKKASFNSEEFIMFVTHPPCEKCLAALKAKGMAYKVVTSFMKFSHKKPRMSLVPASFGLSCARAITYGARKYKVNNWRKVDNLEEYLNALQRHFDAWREGEENDPESGLCHLDHLAANLSFITELKHLPKIKE